MHDSYGGLRINGKAQVLDTQGEVIPGLYAGGEASGGGAQHGIGRATVHGYIAGTNAAQEPIGLTGQRVSPWPAKPVSTHGERTCTVEVAPSEVDAGGELTVTVRASCPHGCDLSGQRVSIRDRDDAELACAKLDECFDEIGAFGTALRLAAPLEVGEHIWGPCFPHVRKTASCMRRPRPRSPSPQWLMRRA